jgi:dipeptidyl aminopeptidase/acylaminoacyl peptidase
MAKQLFFVAAFVAVALIGCQFQEAPPAPAIRVNPTPLDPANVYDPTPMPRGTTGQLAYIGRDGNVYVTSADGASSFAVTDDATAAPEHTGLSYHRVSWSPMGQLAFASVLRSGDMAQGNLYVVDAPGEPVRQVGQSDEHFIIYIYWSPMPCPAQPDCRRLAYLIEEDEGIALRLVELAADRIENRLLGLGQPFYFSWLANGQRMVWHTGGTHLFNPEARLRLYDLELGREELVDHPPGSFLAPAWSPQGDGWLGVSAESLRRFGHEQPLTLTTPTHNHIVFSWSPSGDRIAYAVGLGPDELIYGPLHIFDLESGETMRITAPSFRLVSFFWSPDGQKIAYLKQGAPDAAWWQWRAYDLTRDEDRGFTAFVPSAQMRFIMSSFNQYAQSHRFWSPDSRYLAYADRDSVLVERVWLIDTWANKWADPIFISEGTVGIWSWR